MSILDHIVEHKKSEISSLPEISEDLPKAERNFFAALQGRGKIIAEIKPVSPVTGRVLPKDFDPAEFAAFYEKAGANAISVLTDAHFFGGSFENLQRSKQATTSVPILCKDFILSEKQIRWARKHGADSFLLIVKVLSVDVLQSLITSGRDYGMEPLVEIADEEDLQKALQTDAKIIGINNRDLRDFSVDLSRTFRLAKKIPRDRLVISLSGFSGSDVRLVKNVCNGVLVGSGIGKQLQMTNEELRMEKEKKSKCASETEISDFVVEQMPLGCASETEISDFVVEQMPLGCKIQDILNEFIHPKPLVKFCGVRTEADFELAKELKTPLLGLNFVPNSKRCISEDIADILAKKDRRNMRLVGIFQDQPREYVQNMCSKYRLDFAQLSGHEHPDDFADFPVPIIKSISVPDFSQVDAWDNVADIFLFDGKNPGSGESWVEMYGEVFQKQKIQKPFLIAGGVTPKNAKRFLGLTSADGIDTASGIEDKNGFWDAEKMKTILQETSVFDA